MLADNKKKRAEILVCVLLQILFSAHFALEYITQHGSFFSLKSYAEGTFELPYQSRILVGWVMRAASHVGFIQRISLHLPGPESIRNPYELCSLLLAFVSMLGSLWATAGSINILVSNKTFSRWAAFIVGYMAIFNLLLEYDLPYRLPYDMTSLLFFCVGLNLILRRNWILYYPVLVLATFNRETSCFLILFFLICEYIRKDKRIPGLTAHVISQLVIWIGVKSYLGWLLRNNAADVNGRALMNFHHITQNIKFLLNPGQWPQLISVWGFTLPLIIFGLPYVRDLRIRAAVCIMLPLWFAIMMATGVLIEIRIFNELSSLMALAVSLIIFNWIRERVGLPSAQRGADVQSEQARTAS